MENLLSNSFRAGGSGPFVELELRRDGKLRYSLKGEGLDESLLLEFRVEKEEAVYPMVPTGAALDEMIRRPERQKEG